LHGAIEEFHLNRGESPVGKSPDLAQVCTIAATLDLLLQKLTDIIDRHMETLCGFLDRETSRKGIKNDLRIDHRLSPPAPG
jgi:hypothetical protein